MGLKFKVQTAEVLLRYTWENGGCLSHTNNFFTCSGTNSLLTYVVQFGIGVENAYFRDFPPLHLPSP